MGKYLDKARQASSQFVSPNSLLNTRENIEIDTEESDSAGSTKETNSTKELSGSAHRLTRAGIRVAIFVSEADAGLVVSGERMVQGETASREAGSAGALVFDAQEMSVYIQLSPAERKLFLGLKRIGGRR